MSVLCNPRDRQSGRGSFQICKWKSGAQPLLAEGSTAHCTFTIVKENSFTPFFEAEDSSWSHSSYSWASKPENSIINVIIWSGTEGEEGVSPGSQVTIWQLLLCWGVETFFDYPKAAPSAGCACICTEPEQGIRPSTGWISLLSHTSLPPCTAKAFLPSAHRRVVWSQNTWRESGWQIRDSVPSHPWSWCSNGRGNVSHDTSILLHTKAQVYFVA